METLGKIATSVAAACRAAGVQLVAGDTKVVNKGHGDGLYLNTSGLGVIPPGVDIAPNRARPGDAVIVSGTMGDHGMAIMSVRDGLEFETVIESDTAPLNGLGQAMLAVTPDIHCLRDATRRQWMSGVTASIASTSPLSGAVSLAITVSNSSPSRTDMIAMP